MRPVHESQRYGEAVILRMDPASHAVTPGVTYVSPPESRPDHEPSFVFKSASVRGRLLYVPTQTEILQYGLPDLRLQRRISIPQFNDVHHVIATERETLLVAVTGLDMVVELDLDGGILREWDVLGREPWSRFDRNTDQRKVASTKPHESHPNHVFEWRDQIWVTRFEQRDAVCLTHSERRIEIGGEPPHDGIVRGDHVYFTTVGGTIAIADLMRAEVVERFDLNEMSSSDTLLGWTRGMHVLDEHRVLVAGSTLRPTEFRRNLDWVKRRLGVRAPTRTLPTSVALYDLDRRRETWRVMLDDPALDAVFSIVSDEPA
ncbi:MAG: hypothetical protein GY716_22895 [bacterium]|nr:hypothetical protein [bacterium]